MQEIVRVLIVEDSVEDTFFIVRELQRGGLHVEFERVETSAAMQSALDGQMWDLVICDYSMPSFGGGAALELYLKRGLDIPFIVVSGRMGEEVAVEMLKSGAHYFVTKDDLGRLAGVVKEELFQARARRIRRQTEETSAYLASLVESCDDAIIGQTLAGDVVSWNPGAERLYGYSASEMIGRSMSLLIPQYRGAELSDILKQIRNNVHVERFETLRLRKDGQVVEVSLTVSPIRDAAGRIIGASSVAQDITRRVREENERLALIQDLTSALARVNSIGTQESTAGRMKSAE